ncbi:MAG: hypothetical protein ACJ0A5_04990 [Candidatus Puniceispirillales bacterium]|tara:strand:+ start:1143 stop:1607 length:465 start_codon:yes stop_codon:yes gene_type:complete
MKIISLISIILLFFGCSNINNVNKNPPLVNLVVQQDKYSLILKHQFNNNLKTYDKNLAKFIVETNLSFDTSEALSKKGNNKLNIIKGTVDFKIFNKINSKIIKTGSISSSINTGSVSSLYSVDENNNFAKERIAKYLASKLYRKILLNTYTSEN